uniref:Chitin-binding type-2 domain-containing protein n=1 Tax=Panagrellus redivivus TaxID=6233 RepID=A0A7E4UPI9_PANRE
MLRFLILATCFGMAASTFLLPCFVNRDASFRPGTGKFEPEHIIAEHACTHLILGYAKIYPTQGLYNVFDHNDFDYYERFNAVKAANPGLKTLLSIGGPDTKSWAFSNMLKKRETRKLFATEIINLARQFNFDGVDVAWFYPAASDKAIFVDFLQDLKSASWVSTDGGRQRYMTITATVSGIPHIIENHYDAVAFAHIVNFINVQTYDYHNGEVTGLNAPLHAPENDTSNLNVEYSLNLWHKLGMPKNKIVMGIPSYGRVWYLEDKNNTKIGAPAFPAAPFPNSNIEGVVPYAEMCRHIPENSPWIFDPFPTPGFVVEGTFWFSYEDEYAVLQKITFVKQNGYAGAFFNSLDMDDFRGYCKYRFTPTTYPLLGIITHFLEHLPSEYQPPTEAPTTTTKNPINPYFNPCDIQDTVNHWNKDNDDCRKYYYCEGRVLHHLSCSEGLFWQQDGGRDGFGCTYENYAGCRYAKPYTPPIGFNYTKV